MNTTWYKTPSQWGSPKIESVEIVSSTEKTVTVAATKYGRERRTSRMSTWGSYFPTWAEAHAELLRSSEEKLNAARRSLQAAQDYYGNVKGMKPESDK